MSGTVKYCVMCFEENSWPEIYYTESLTEAVKLARSAGDTIDVIEDDKIRPLNDEEKAEVYGHKDIGGWSKS